MIKKITLLGVVGMLCLHLNAQSVRIEPLNIGDTVPNLVFTNVIHYKDTVVNLSDFKEKLVILDFWATSCMGCVYSLPKIDSLQNQYKNEVQFLLVNPKSARDDLARVNRFLGILKRNTGHDVRLPTALFDEVAEQYFPFVFLPHCVWIDTNNVIRAITSSKEITVENIEAVLKNQNVRLPLKDDKQKISPND